MRKVSLRERFKYWFDNTMARGTAALVGWLFVCSLALIFVSAALVAVLHIAPELEEGGQADFWTLSWMSLMRTLDPTGFGDDEGPYLIVSVLVVIGGVFIVSTLIGILTAGLEGRLEELRKGRSLVVERDHTVILGWSPQIFSVVAELAEAARSKGGACIVVLAERDKVEMEDELRDKCGDLQGSRIVCRTGSPIDLGDLELVNPDDARCFIALSGESDDPDIHVIKTLLALMGREKRAEGQRHIVAQIVHPRNQRVAEIIARGEAEIVLVNDVIARIAVQTCRQSGLSVVFSELLNFVGDEIYMSREPTLVGKTFREALFAYETSSVMGVRRADGAILLNPADDLVIAADDEIIAISEDDDTVRVSGKPMPRIEEEKISEAEPVGAGPERTLVLGWNRRGEAILRELETYVEAGSELTVICDEVNYEEELAPAVERLTKHTFTFESGDPTDRDVLDAAHPESFDHVIVLSPNEDDMQAADARTLVTLVHLRDIADATGSDFGIVTEMLDIKNRDLVAVARADDFVVSDRLASLMVTQVAENKHLTRVFRELLSAEGCEIYLKPASDYVALGEEVGYYTLVESVRRRGEIALGYRMDRENKKPPAFGVRLNPDKSARMTFGEADKIIVLAA